MNPGAARPQLARQHDQDGPGGLGSPGPRFRLVRGLVVDADFGGSATASGSALTPDYCARRGACGLFLKRDEWSERIAPRT